MPAKGNSKLNNTNVIQEYLEGKSACELGEKYGISRVAVKNYLVKHGVEMRKSNDEIYAGSHASPYHFNEHWLDELDCEEKFYFLRFFAADGYNKSQSNNAIIGLQEEDFELLDKFKKLLESDRPIYRGKNGKNKLGEIRYKAIFELTSKYFCTKLTELGLMRAKTLKIRFPNYIPEEYLSAYIRGVFDGDGSISISYSSTKPKGSSCIARTEMFIKDLQKILIDKLGVHATVESQRENAWLVDVNRQEDIKVFLDWMYKDAKIYLERKYQKYQEFLSVRDFTEESAGQRKRRIQANKNFIIQDYLDGELTLVQISKKFNCSTNAIIRLLKQENMQPNRANKNSNRKE